MSSKDCKKRQHSKTLSIAQATTRRNKQLRLFRTARDQENNFVAMAGFLDSIYPETVANWLNRVHP